MGAAIDAVALKADKPEYTARKAEKAARKEAKASFAGLTFEELSNTQKDALLKELAIRAGLLADS